MSEIADNSGLRSEQERALEEGHEIEIPNNAGLCLLTPWFPRLFDMLGYLDEEKKNFKEGESRVRAIFLIQYLVDPERRVFSEQELLFNRLLVALPAQVALPRQIELTDQEKELANKLIESVKSNWRAMQNASTDVIRQSFLTRSGHLKLQDQRWCLAIEPRAHDILLDSMPWSFSPIHSPWMTKYIQVLWRQ